MYNAWSYGGEGDAVAAAVAGTRRLFLPHRVTYDEL